MLLATSVFAQNVVHYTTTNDNVKYLFATAEPVLHLKPGDILTPTRSIVSATACANLAIR
jgi:hypothetical protein